MDQFMIRALYQGKLLGEYRYNPATKNTVMIGRYEDNDISLPLPTVGRRHCLLEQYGGQWYVTNYSENGTFINGRPAAERMPLQETDMLTILPGEHSIQILLEPIREPVYSAPPGNKQTGAVGGSGLELIAFVGGSEIKRLHLNLTSGRQLSFGSSGECELMLPSELVYPRHGRLVTENGKCWLMDYSPEGLFMNGQSVRDGRPLEVRAGDTLRIDWTTGSAPMGVLLVFSDSGREWKKLSLAGKDRFTIGRSPDSDLQLFHVGASRRHAVISRMAPGQYALENYGLNGTLADGRMVQGRWTLGSRSEIQIVGTTLYLVGDTLYYLKALGGMRLEARRLTRDVGSGRTRKRILNDVNISIEPGEFVAIVGGSGCGKTTLLNALTGYEQATGGGVFVGDKPLYENYDYFKSLIGFVPQQDIVYDHLKLGKMLAYTAKLRMPEDTSPEEYQNRIRDVLEMVELSEYADSMVKKLSGGQKKRASIAVELLADPGLFFLDEPTSGLDPGTERNLMGTLRRLATEKRKTVIMVTHTTLNLHMCDKIVFMGKGGKLCFCGGPEEALRFFGVDNFVDIYNLVAGNTDDWHERFCSSRSRVTRGESEPAEIKQIRRPAFLKQSWILSKRYLNLICNDRARLLMMLLEPIIMGLILYICKPEDAFTEFLGTRNLLFTYVCCAIWIGIFNSVQEICKEREILKREYMANLRLSAYISSKFSVLNLLCLIQSALLYAVFAFTCGLPEQGILMDSPQPEMFVTTFLTILSSTCMGLALSASVKNPDRAMTMSPFLLVVQLVFAGIIFTLEGLVDKISNATISRWSISALGVSAELEAMNESYMKRQQMLTGVVSDGKDAAAEMFAYTTENLFVCWGVLMGFSVLFCLLSILLLRNVSKDKR